MAGSSALSFHCMICYEEFHGDRYPVVLPCGHTYVCNLCAERLDKCMECRTLLTMSVPKQKQASTTTQRTGWTRSSNIARAQKGPAITMEKKRLPLPKNVVLLSLMEATEVASEIAESTRASSQMNGFNDGDSIQEDVEAEKIKAGTSLAIGAYGTYVVADKKGLQIYPSRPTMSQDEEEKKAATATNDDDDDDVDNLVRFFHLDHKMDGVSSEDELRESPKKNRAPLELNYGDRVQIVSLHDNEWAKLARGYGFVRAGENQLVKVGGSVDRACRLEAMLHAISARKKQLVFEKQHMDDKFVNLMSNLQSSLANDEDLTVVPAYTAKEGEDDVVPLLLVPELKTEETRSDEAQGDDLRKPKTIARQESSTLQEMASFGMSMLETLSATVTQTAGEISPTSRRFESRATPPPSPTKGTRARIPAARSSSSQPRHYRNGSRSTVDFRTGLSGHMGLVSYMVHPHDYLDRDSGRTPFRMSIHSGLTMSHRSDHRAARERRPSRDDTVATAETGASDLQTMGESSSI